MNFLGLENPCEMENTQTTHSYSSGLSNTNIQSSYHHHRYTCIAQDCVVTHVNIAGIDVVIVFTVDGPVTVDWDRLEYHTTFIICTVRDTVVLWVVRVSCELKRFSLSTCMYRENNKLNTNFCVCNGVSHHVVVV